MPEAAGRPMRSLGPRVATGLGLAAFAALVVAYSPPWGLALVVSVISALQTWEFARLALPGGRPLEQAAGLICAALAPWAALFGGAALAAALAAATLALACAALAAQDELGPALQAAMTRGWGVVYLAGTLSCLLLLLPHPQGRALVLFLVATVVAADTGAYFAGHALGRRQLAPRLSPGKTWEGAAGGLAAAAAVGAVWSALWLPDTAPVLGGLMAAGLAVVSIAGDLLESSLKRAAGAKDSGALLPGHGGVMDRLDGIMAASPFLLLMRELWW